MIYNGYDGVFSISNLKVSFMDHKWAIRCVPKGIINGPSGAKGLRLSMRYFLNACIYRQHVQHVPVNVMFSININNMHE